MDPIRLLEEFYDPGSMTFDVLLTHGRLVAAKALSVADSLSPRLKTDRAFIEEAALLHDIGIFLTNTPDLGCTGPHPYVCHGYLGGELLEKKGLWRHARVCDRHVGVGISAAEIRQLSLPLPERDMRPVSIEEEIICYADKFFSKSNTGGSREKSVPDILLSLTPYGQDKVNRFAAWVQRFEGH